MKWKEAMEPQWKLIALKGVAHLRRYVISYQPVILSTTVGFRNTLKLFWHCANVNPTLQDSYLNRLSLSLQSHFITLLQRCQLTSAKLSFPTKWQCWYNQSSDVATTLWKHLCVCWERLYLIYCGILFLLMQKLRWCINPSLVLNVWLQMLQPFFCPLVWLNLVGLKISFCLNFLQWQLAMLKSLFISVPY